MFMVVAPAFAPHPETRSKGADSLPTAPKPQATRLTANGQIPLNDLIATDWSLGIETKDPRMEPGQTFNTVASIYDAQRSGYPEALFDDLLRISRLRPDDRVLEVGCGTGQATAGFAARGLRVVATDPGDQLLDIARPKFDQFPNVQFEISSFEDWPLGERSFHRRSKGTSTDLGFARGRCPQRRGAELS